MPFLVIDVLMLTRAAAAAAAAATITMRLSILLFGALQRVEHGHIMNEELQAINHAP
jgi:hypothetical protein